MNSEPVEIVRVLRRMRGGSQSHLVEGNDGHCYVAKFKGNPQGTRTLINEWFAHQLFRQLDISAPPVRVLRLTKAVQAVSEDLVFRSGDTRSTVEAGLHFGSQCPVNPATTAIFDLLPRHVLSRVVNPEDFAKTLVADLFLAQTDARQAIFVREGTGQAAFRMRAYLIDNGGMLGGSLWQLSSSTFQRLYWDRTIYSLFDMRIECAQALDIMEAITKEDLYGLGEDIPRAWFLPGDDADWARLLDRLHARKSQLPRLVFDQLKTLDLSQQGKPSHASSHENVIRASHSPELEQQLPDVAVLPAFG